MNHFNRIQYKKNLLNIKQLYISFTILVWFDFYRLRDMKIENQTNKVDFQNSQTESIFFIIKN